MNSYSISTLAALYDKPRSVWIWQTHSTYTEEHYKDAALLHSSPMEKKGVTSTKGEQKMALFADVLLLALTQPTQTLPKLMTMLEFG